MTKIWEEQPADTGAPVGSISLSLDEARLLQKSVGRTLDALLKQLDRMQGHGREAVKADYAVYDGLAALLADAVSDLVEAS